MRQLTLRRVLTLALFAVFVASVRPCSAQTADFLFGQPHGTIALRSGWMMPRAGSDLFTFVQDQLTIERKDFNAPSIGFDLDMAITPRIAGVAGFDFSGSTATSEYRHLVDNQRLPIKQTTNLRETNVSGSIKVALTPRGREVSQHAWIPSMVTPYVGAGAGLMHYTFGQTGDFVDFTDSSVFPHTYSSDGWSPSVHVLGGVDVKAWNRVYFSGEARYLWSHADLGSDFSGFNPIDLAGLRATGGIRYMF
jgi:opacity protein-like surface antigen